MKIIRKPKLSSNQPQRDFSVHIEWGGGVLAVTPYFDPETYDGHRFAVFHGYQIDLELHNFHRRYRCWPLDKDEPRQWTPCKVTAYWLLNCCELASVRRAQKLVGGGISLFYSLPFYKLEPVPA